MTIPSEGSFEPLIIPSNRITCRKRNVEQRIVVWLDSDLNSYPHYVNANTTLSPFLDIRFIDICGNNNY